MLDEGLDARLRSASRFLERVARRRPEAWAGNDFCAALSDEDLLAKARAVRVPAGSDSEVGAALRALREFEMARIAVRDLVGLAALDTTLHDLSRLADACIGVALDQAWQGLVRRYGVPRDGAGEAVRPLVLGMGKLGGGELNFSSDVDLIFLHGAAGETEGGEQPGVANELFFARLGQSVQRLLSEQTEHGFVFRVDTLLRPFGSAGPVSIAIDAALRYYREHGREWERYAMIKARPVAGDLAAGRALIMALQPFVYRRYLDFGAILSLRQLKKLIEEDVARRGAADDIKLGRGGIRELEFVVQAFQMVRGGQEPRLRDPRLRRVLAVLGDIGLMTADEVATLDEAYVFLRRLENAIQIYDDQQTHALPVSDAPRAALCAALGFPDWPSLHQAWLIRRERVHEAFRKVFARPEATSQPVAPARWSSTRPEAVPAAFAAGFGSEAAAITERLAAMSRSRLAGTLSPASAARLSALLPRLLERCAAEPDPDTAADRVLKVIQAVLGRSTYLALLEESDIARAQLVRLCAASPWISQQIAATPAVLDELLDPDSLYAPPVKAGMQAELARRLSDIPLSDVEAGMDALRRYRHETTLRIAAADVTGRLPLVQVSDRLTWLAETVVESALQRAAVELEVTHGVALRSTGEPAGFAAIAYGKLGGIELGYGSDLDLVFIHDGDAPERESLGGQRPIASAALLTRLGQRLIHWLTTLTPAGRAYEVDVELRPSGRSGLPVIGFRGFEDYQRQHAWTWEHQALTRARAVAGSIPLGERFAVLRREVMALPRDPQKLRSEVQQMRARMRQSLDKSNPEAWDVKQGRGGLIDIEFITQFLMLREAHAHPQVSLWTDNWRQLDALADAGVLPSADRDGLLAIYRAYRAYAHQRSLQNLSPQARPDEFAQPRAEVERLWEAWIGPGEA